MRQRWTRVWWVTLMVLGLLYAGWTSLGEEPATPEIRTQPDVPTRVADAAPRAPARSGPRPPAASAPPGPPAPVDEAFDLVDPESPRVRCPVDLGGGVYEAGGVDRLWVGGGWLHATVPEAAGTAVVTQDLGVAGTLTWSDAAAGRWGACTVTTPERVPITGTVTFPDGAPAGGVRVRTCDHGGLVNTDADGRFAFEAAVGVTCHPMAFGEADDAFGKGTYVELVVDGPATLSLEVPERDAWTTADELDAMGLQLAALFGRMVDARGAEVPPEVAILESGEGSPAARAVLEGWVDAHDRRLELMAEQIGLLEDPETRVAAAKEAWLDQY